MQWYNVCHIHSSKVVEFYTDINECMEEDHSCNQTCVNTPGSYYCNCELGFQPVSVTECEGNHALVHSHCEPS